ncbi:MAG TPA: RNA polymerase sigma-70 factor [Chitinophagaceae bacterium]|nr:RNA polymerase sigma-70 factor [Chitinophagaceae bacterium]
MSYQLLAEDVLLKLLKIGDELAFKEIYLRYWQHLYFVALNKSNNREVAEDIVQSVFTDLWDKRERHLIQNISFYLYASVKYQVINYIKFAISKKAHLSNFNERQKTEENSAELTLLVQELNEAIDKAISQLPPKTQTIFRMSRVESHSNKDISRILDLSEKTVEYHITQSLKALRFYLKDFILVDLMLLLVLQIF